MKCDKYECGATYAVALDFDSRDQEAVVGVEHAHKSYSLLFSQHLGRLVVDVAET